MEKVPFYIGYSGASRPTGRGPVNRDALVKNDLLSARMIAIRRSKANRTNLMTSRPAGAIGARNPSLHAIGLGRSDG